VVLIAVFSGVVALLVHLYEFITGVGSMDEAREVWCLHPPPFIYLQRVSCFMAFRTLPRPVGLFVLSDVCQWAFMFFNLFCLVLSAPIGSTFLQAFLLHF
jgi:hypothetical protein